MKYLLCMLLMISLTACSAGLRWQSDGNVEGYVKAPKIQPESKQIWRFLHDPQTRAGVRTVTNAGTLYKEINLSTAPA